MTKLTTGRLEKLQDNLLQFQDAYSDPADKENYDIFVDALHVIDEFKAAKEKILAYEQAAKNPVAFVDERSAASGGICWAKSGKRELQHGTELYAAPVLPKQPELVVLTDEQIDAVLDSNANMAYIISDKRERLRMFAREIIRTAMISTAPAQPVIPEQPKTELVDLSQQVEILNRILNWILKELPVPTQKATVMAIRLSSVIDVISDLEVSTQEQEQK